MDWHCFWFGAEYLPWYIIVLRTVTVYLAITVATRLLKFRHVGIMAQHNYLVAAGVVGVAGSRLISPHSSLVLGLIAIGFLTALGLFFSYLDLKVPKQFRSEPVSLLENGQIDRQNLRKFHMTIENLLGQLRLKGVFNLALAEKVYLEGTGKVSVIKKLENKPVCRQQLKLPPKLACPPAHLIYNGIIIEENLKRLALDKCWLVKELQRKGFYTPEQVFLATLLPDGTLYTSSQ